MVRLKEIAQSAGVTMMTVSKALRDKPDIAKTTRERIRAIARQMGYVPNAAAQGLRTRHTRLLGLVIPTTTDPIYSRVMLAIEERAHELGYDLILAHSLGKVEREEAALRRLIARHVDGLFVSPVYRLEPEAPIYRELERRGIPTVILGHRGAFCRHFANVETNDQVASEALTQHLIGLGHRKIAFFAGPLVAPWAQDRLEGYRRAHRNAGVTLDDRLVFRAGSTIEEGASAALQFMQESPGATAIQAANDMIAIGAADALLNQGVRIPDDLSVAGFGNVLVAEFFRVPLTTIRQPKLRLGVEAMNSMMKLLQLEPIGTKRLPAEVIVRASTAAPPQRR